MKKHDNSIMDFYFINENDKLRIISLDGKTVSSFKNSEKKATERAMLAMKLFGEWDSTAFGAYMSCPLTFSDIAENNSNKKLCFISERLADIIYYPYIDINLKNKINKDVENFYNDKEIQLKYNFTILHPICLEINEEKKLLDYRPLYSITDNVIKQIMSKELDYITISDLEKYIKEGEFIKKYINIQKDMFKIALSEIKQGKKINHWMWYIFPQIKGLGNSEMSNFYSINSIEEAQLYWENETLRNNYIILCNELLKLNMNNPVEVFGEIDSLKLRSSLTLFNYIDNNSESIKKVLLKYYKGKLDEKTLNILKSISFNK